MELSLKHFVIQRKIQSEITRDRFFKVLLVTNMYVRYKADVKLWSPLQQQQHVQRAHRLEVRLHAG